MYTSNRPVCFITGRFFTIYIYQYESSKKVKIFKIYFQNKHKISKTPVGQKSKHSSRHFLIGHMSMMFALVLSLLCAISQNGRVLALTFRPADNVPVVRLRSVASASTHFGLTSLLSFCTNIFRISSKIEPIRKF